MAQTWNTVRVFISSTFRDMHAERDHLVRVVFPELRERCAKRRLHLVDVDLRWGVTEEEAEQGKVLEVILDEIDRSRPFFVAILGERYGSIPDRVPEDAQFAHPWLGDYPAHSLTALEIVHGVLRNRDMAGRSFFYLRDPRFIALLPENKRTDFAAESVEAAGKVAALKDESRRSGRPVLEDYPCRWDDDQGRLVDLDVFGQRVLEDLWSAICAEYPEEAPELPARVSREEAYAAANERLLAGADVLVAIWDGQEARGDGGTAEVVAGARARGLPLVWIHAGNRKPGTIEPAASLGADQGRVTYEGP